jgi:hypothetical protein
MRLSSFTLLGFLPCSTPDAVPTPDASDDNAVAEGIDGESGEPAVCVDEWPATEALSSDSSVEAAEPEAILAVRLISSIGFGKGCG